MIKSYEKSIPFSLSILYNLIKYEEDILNQDFLSHYKEI